MEDEGRGVLSSGDKIARWVGQGDPVYSVFWTSSSLMVKDITLLHTWTSYSSRGLYLMLVETSMRRLHSAMDETMPGAG
jgi:hypothetical protein